MLGLYMAACTLRVLISKLLGMLLIRSAATVRPLVRFNHAVSANSRQIAEELNSFLFENNRDKQTLKLLSTLGISDAILNSEPKGLQRSFSATKSSRKQGYDLFKEQYSHLRQSRRRFAVPYEQLTTEIKATFDDNDYVTHSYKSRDRVWRGYETVYFLKKFLDHTYDPYKFLSLYPTEIILDKLRNQDKYEPDYYDDLIFKAFNSPVDKVQEFFLSHPPPKIPNRYMNFYISCKQARKLLKQNQSFPSTQAGRASLWKEFTEEEKEAYTICDYEYLTYRHIKDYWELAIVLNYMNPDFDWRLAMAFGGYYYHNGHYLKYPLYFQCNEVGLLSVKPRVEEISIEYARPELTASLILKYK